MKEGKDAAPGGEFHVSIGVARLPKDGMPLRVEADAAERSAIARRFDLVSVESFEADLEALRWQGDGVCVEGVLRAGVVQSDVVTLEPVSQFVEDDVRLFFVPEGSRLAAPVDAEEAEIDVDPAEDVPETFRGDRIDVGEALVQFFGLAVDPYPRSDGVVFAGLREGELEPSPFAVLGKLRGKKG